MERHSQISANPALWLHQSKERSNPKLTNSNREIQEMTVDNLLQTNPGLQHQIGRDLLFHPTFNKPEKMIEEHMIGEESSHPTYSRIWNRTSVVAMEPLSINHNLHLDYRDPQSINTGE